MIKESKALTLIELLVSVAIVGVMILAVNSVSMFAWNRTINSERRSRVLNEISFAMEHMSKNISRAIGNKGNTLGPSLRAYLDGRGIRIRIDNNPANGRLDATDRWVAYRHVNVGMTTSEIRFWPNAGNTEIPAGIRETIARHIRRTDFAAPESTWGLVFDGNFDGTDADLGITIRGRWLPNRPVALNNPEAEMQTRINMPSISAN